MTLAAGALAEAPSQGEMVALGSERTASQG